MGPLATVEFQRLLILATPAISDQGHIEVIVHNNPNVPDRTQSLADDGGLSYSQAVIDSGRKLIEAGATLLVMPCITAHARFELIQSKLSARLVNMIEVTAQKILMHHPHPVGILATDGTVNDGLISRVFSKSGIAVIHPDAVDQQKVMRAVYAVKSGATKNSAELTEVVRCLKARGARSALLGCTELSFYESALNQTLPTINPMKALAEHLVLYAGARQNSRKARAHATI